MAIPQTPEQVREYIRAYFTEALRDTPGVSAVLMWVDDTLEVLPYRDTHRLFRSLWIMEERIDERERKLGIERNADAGEEEEE